MKAEYVDHMGTDLSVVNAARVSFDKVSEWETVSGYPAEYGEETLKLSDKDEKLIRYLAEHDHWTPFAHTAITLRIQAPVPVRTQCFKHKVGFVENEESRRYISTAPDVYYPAVWRAAAANKKQGSSDEVVNPVFRTRMHGDQTITDAVQRLYDHALDLYEEMIEHGVCPEQARFILPQGVEVQWIWTGNLASYARFYNQRTAPNAQAETAELARAVGAIIEKLFPVSWAALTGRP